MSAIAVIVVAIAVVWLVGMLVAGVRRSVKAQAEARHNQPQPHRSRAEQSRTEPAVRNEG